MGGRRWFIAALAVLLVFTWAPLGTARSPKTVVHVSPKQAAGIIRSGDAIILDVRTHREFNAGHIAGARLIPVQAMPSDLKKLTGATESKLLVYCRTGRRSTIALSMLKKLPFTTIYHLDGGIRDWRRAGLPVTPPKP